MGDLASSFSGLFFLLYAVFLSFEDFESSSELW